MIDGHVIRQLRSTAWLAYIEGCAATRGHHHQSIQDQCYSRVYDLPCVSVCLSVYECIVADYVDRLYECSTTVISSSCVCCLFLLLRLLFAIQSCSQIAPSILIPPQYPAMSLPLRISVSRLYNSTKLIKTAASFLYIIRIVFLISLILLRRARNFFTICSDSCMSLAKI